MQVIDFESLPVGTILTDSQPTYIDGFKFVVLTYGQAVRNASTPRGYSNVMVDPTYSNGYGADVEIFNAAHQYAPNAPFIFHSVEYGSLNGGNGQISFHVEAYLYGSSDIHSNTTTPTTSGLTLTALDLGVLDVPLKSMRFEILSQGSDFYYDQLEVQPLDPPSTAPTAIPSVLPLQSSMLPTYIPTLLSG